MKSILKIESTTNNLIKAKNIETKNISIHEKNYMDLVIFLIDMFTASQ